MARVRKLAKAIDTLKAQIDQIDGGISGDQARVMYLQAQYVTRSLEDILFKTNGWKEKGGDHGGLSGV